MTLINHLFQLVGVWVLLLAGSRPVLAAKSSEAAVDQAKIDKYKYLLDNFIPATKKFDEAFKWTDVLDAYVPLAADCSARCLTCAPGCSPSCCALGAVQSSAGPDASLRVGNGFNLPDISISPGRFPGHLPIPPLACPCYCQSSCPRNIQIVCCFTPISARGDGQDGGARSVAAEAEVSGENHDGTEAEPEIAPGVEDTQKNLLDKITGSRHSDNIPLLQRIWGRPNRPLACPCFCDPTCPPYIQAVCCTTPGSNDFTLPPGGNPFKVIKAPKTHETLALVTAKAGGEVVSALAAVNLTVFDSFITLNLVQGLERGDEVTYNKERGTFEITLSVVFGDSTGKDAATTTFAQTFVVIGGERLLEQEQILLGSGALGRINSLVGVEETKLKALQLQAGVPVLTGPKS